MAPGRLATPVLSDADVDVPAGRLTDALSREGTRGGRTADKAADTALGVHSFTLTYHNLVPSHTLSRRVYMF